VLSFDQYNLNIERCNFRELRGRKPELDLEGEVVLHGFLARKHFGLSLEGLVLGPSMVAEVVDHLAHSIAGVVVDHTLVEQENAHIVELEVRHNLEVDNHHHHSDVAAADAAVVEEDIVEEDILEAGVAAILLEVGNRHSVEDLQDTDCSRTC